MIERIREEKIGLALILFTLIGAIFIAVLFGVNESLFKDYASSVANLPNMLPEKASGEADKIWRYAQRFHFHSGGIASYCLGLYLIIINLDLKKRCKRIASISVGLHSLYPYYWLTVFFYSPKVGRAVAKNMLIAELFVYVSMITFIIVMMYIIGNVFFGKFKESK